eukprot:gb/GFBE01074971.1/.p1 GENE.gb/GFBE01074971.1/~~gb/GFBE01074971.1/.p1  ORF type:complete len:490 (+),score=113.29 gb/GFBE01074971.1/:1-1470(+)
MKLSRPLAGLVLSWALSLGGGLALVQLRSHELSAELPNLLQETFREVNGSLAEELSKIGGDAGVKLRSAADTIDKLEGSVLGLARSGLGNTTDVLVDEIRKLIQDNMIPGVVNQSDIAEKSLRDLRKGFDDCQRYANASLLGEPSQNFTAHSSAHKACRKNQSLMAAALPARQSAWEAAQSTKASACGAYETANTIPQADECGLPAYGKPARERVVYLRDHFRLKHQKLVELKHNCDWATTFEAEKRKELDDLQAKLAAKDQACDLEQRNMDQVACDHVQQLQLACSSYDSCYDAKRDTYVQEYNKTQAFEVGLRAEYRALKRIECIVIEWLAGNLEEGIETCRAKTHSSEPVAINWTGLDVPAKEPCGQTNGAAQIHSPASQEYNRSEYAPLPADAPAEACSALPCCSAPPTGSTALLHANHVSAHADASSASLVGLTRPARHRQPQRRLSLMQSGADPVPGGAIPVPDDLPALSSISVPSVGISLPG